MSAAYFTKGKTAVITGAASGIGKAAAKRFVSLGMNVIMADINESLLKLSAESFPQSHGKVLTMKCDVSKPEHLVALRDLAYAEFNQVDVLMNNAGISGNKGQGSTFKFLDNWHHTFAVNFWGQRNGLEAFVEPMHAQSSPSIIVCTGSKQGITNPPGNGSYNCSKAAVKSMTEHLAWELREQKSPVSAHLLVPGWTWTSMTGDNADDTSGKKPEGAWSPEQVIDYMVGKVEAREFYIICPDNSVDTATDNARMLWNVEDIANRRPALSRWSDEHKEEYEQFIKAKVRTEE